VPAAGGLRLLLVVAGQRLPAKLDARSECHRICPARGGLMSGAVLFLFRRQQGR
jgi:hypothetical protein